MLLAHGLPLIASDCLRVLPIASPPQVLLAHGDPPGKEVTNKQVVTALTPAPTPSGAQDSLGLLSGGWDQTVRAPADRTFQTPSRRLPEPPRRLPDAPDAPDAFQTPSKSFQILPEPPRAFQNLPDAFQTPPSPRPARRSARRSRGLTCAVSSARTFHNLPAPPQPRLSAPYRALACRCACGRPCPVARRRRPPRCRTSRCDGF